MWPGRYREYRGPIRVTASMYPLQVKGLYLVVLKVFPQKTQMMRYYNFILLSWLEGKHADDEAEGLWRIYDKLYDLSDFAARHPGGASWIECTRGTDITEPFESHHIEERAREMLTKFEVRQASKPRNYKFTLKENGFYMTLKRRVREKLRKIEYSPTKKTEVLISF